MTVTLSGTILWPEFVRKRRFRGHRMAASSARVILWIRPVDSAPSAYASFEKKPYICGKSTGF